VTQQSTSSVIDEMNALLDNLNAAHQARVDRDLGKLDAIVKGLDVGWAADDEPVSEPHGRQPDLPRPRGPREWLPAVSLPQRNTPGGDYGPLVRDKLIARALEKGGW
jgi:hypothetical protein